MSSVVGVRIFSGTTQLQKLKVNVLTYKHHVLCLSVHYQWYSLTTSLIFCRINKFDKNR